MSVTPVALASANVRRWNLQSLGGRLMDVVRTVLTTCLRPWTAKIQESLRRTKRTLFVVDDEVKFARNCRDRVSTHLHSLRMMLNDADASGGRGRGASAVINIIPEDIHLLARDVVCQCVNFVDACDELITLGEKISNSAGNPSAIRSACSSSNQNQAEIFYTNAINASVAKSRQSIFPSSSTTTTPTKFSETTRPTTNSSRRATTPLSASPNRTMMMKRIPDFHNNHIPVEIVIFEKNNNNQNQNSNNSPSEDITKRIRATTPSPTNNNNSILPRERDFSKYYVHSPDGVSPITERRQEQKSDYEKYRQEREQQRNHRQQNDQDESITFKNLFLNSKSNINNVSSVSSSSLSTAHQDYSLRIIEKEKSKLEKQRSVVCRAPDHRSGQYLVDPNRLSPRQRSTIESAVNSMINSRAELSDEDRLWLVASLRRLKVDGELSNPY